MSDDKANITDIWRGLELFTNREQFIELFIRYLNEDPPKEKVLFFHGDGGNGKTLFLYYLQEHFCKRFSRENWEWLISEFTGDNLIEQVKQSLGASLVPFAIVDFRLRTGAFDCLLKLRRDIGVHGIKFPLFDLACVWYLHKTNELSRDKLKELFPAAEADFLTEIVDSFSGTSIAALAKVSVKIIEKYLGPSIRENFTIWWQKRGIDEEKVARILKMNAEIDLWKHLPDFFAEDLNSAFNDNNVAEKIVLFFDTHEAFWGDQRNMAEGPYFSRDEWLRRLLKSIYKSPHIVTVVAGRESPLWDQASDSCIEDKLLDIHLMGHLTPADADDFLQRAGITNSHLRPSLINYAEVRANEVHPLYLALLADIVLAAEGEGKILTPDDFHAQLETDLQEKGLIERLLLYVNPEIRDAVTALAASRAFDGRIFTELGKQMNFASTRASFETIKRFSFIWPAEGRGEGWYKVHDLLRRLFDEHRRAEINEAHAILEEFYLNKMETGDEIPDIEAIYHANRIDASKGVRQWINNFENSIERSRYQLCRSLLDIRREMIIPDDFDIGDVSKWEGDYYFSLSLYSEARQEFSESLAAYNRVLLLVPDKDAAYNNKGIVFQKLGDLEARLARHEEALRSFEASVAAYEKAISLAPDSVHAYNNKGVVLQSRGKMETRLTRYEDALKSYGESVEACERALSLVPDNNMAAHSNKGSALLGRGELESMLTLHEVALTTYGDSIKAYDEALSLAPDDVYTHNNKGVALQQRGELQTRLNRYEDALKSYGESVKACDGALRLAPEFIVAHNTKGSGLLRLGELETRLARYEDALKSYEESVAAYNEALSLAPNNVDTQNNKGIVLQKRGGLEARLNRYNDALKTYEESLATLNYALSLAPNNIAAHNSKGNVLQLRGGLEVKLLQHDDALKSHEEAIAAYDRALLLAPDDVYTHTNKGLALENSAVLRFALEQPVKGFEDLMSSHEEYTKSLELAPNNEDIKIRQKVTLDLIDRIAKEHNEKGIE